MPERAVAKDRIPEMPRSLTTVCFVTVALIIGLVSASGASAHSTCSAKPSTAGGWPMSGHDLSGSRTQSRETGLTPAVARTLQPVWAFYTGHPSGGPELSLADLNSTPTEAGGCLYIGAAVADTHFPNAFAIDVDSGKAVWQRHLPLTAAAIGGAIVGSPAVSGHVVYFLVNDKGDGTKRGPFVVAMNRHTGEVRWRSEPIVTQRNSFTNASVVVVRGVLIAGFSGEEGDPEAQGGLALLSTRNGKLLARIYTIPPGEWIGADGERFGGGGVWTTPAVDAAGYAYVGTGNPFSKEHEHPNTNAIIKVDVRRGRRTFGRIVGSYKGDIEQSNDLVHAATRPTCAVLPDPAIREIPQLGDPRLAALQGVLGDSVPCGQLDLDFGAAPNLFRDASGRQIVGDLQKSGVYHAVYTDTMKRAWTATAGASCQVCNGASTAFVQATNEIYAAVSPGSFMTAISAQDGRVRWRTFAADIFHYPAVSAAAGVVYTVDNGGRFLDVFDARTGDLLALRSLARDGAPEAATLMNSAGVAIARRGVYVAAGSHVIAYRPGGSTK
jgi:outer membrane protein assembly factor BamB